MRGPAHRHDWRYDPVRHVFECGPNGCGQQFVAEIFDNWQPSLTVVISRNEDSTFDAVLLIHEPVGTADERAECQLVMGRGASPSEALATIEADMATRGEDWK